MDFSLSEEQELLASSARSLAADLFGDIDHGTGVETEEIGDERNHDSADTQPAPDSHPPSILDVAACPLVA